MFKGSIPALVTPFTNAGAVDEEAFAAHVEWQIGEGSHGLVPVGTTGESPTLSHDEHKRVVELCIEVAAGRVPVIAGALSSRSGDGRDVNSAPVSMLTTVTSNSGGTWAGAAAACAWSKSDGWKSAVSRPAASAAAAFTASRSAGPWLGVSSTDCGARGFLEAMMIFLMTGTA